MYDARVRGSAFDLRAEMRLAAGDAWVPNCLQKIWLRGAALASISRLRATFFRSAAGALFHAGIARNDLISTRIEACLSVLDPSNLIVSLHRPLFPATGPWAGLRIAEAQNHDAG